MATKTTYGFQKIEYVIHVDLHAPNGDKIHIEALTTEHQVQILEIDTNLMIYRGVEHPPWDIHGDCFNAYLDDVHKPSMQHIQCHWPTQQFPP
jgi:hypothetical protein